MPGYAINFIEKLCSFSGKEKYEPHYDQILQHLAELLVVAHLAEEMDDSWIFSAEPTTGSSKKNPEIKMNREDVEILVEVKSPQFLKYQAIRAGADILLASRFPKGIDLATALSTPDGNHALPRDNNVKDFLISADTKFAPFKENQLKTISVLVIVWDDFIYEPITALINSHSGLLTEKSFYKNKQGDAITFPNIDNILILRNMTQIANATRDVIVSDGLQHPLDYGQRGQTLSKAFIQLTEEDYGIDLMEIFQCENINDLQNFAEYRPQEIILRV